MKNSWNYANDHFIGIFNNAKSYMYITLNLAIVQCKELLASSITNVLIVSLKH